MTRAEYARRLSSIQQSVHQAHAGVFAYKEGGESVDHIDSILAEARALMAVLDEGLAGTPKPEPIDVDEIARRGRERAEVVMARYREVCDG